MLPVVPAPNFESPVAPILNEDLARVRAVVVAAGGASEVQWAAAVVISGDHHHLVVTSDRGRGWMPAGTVLPAEVVSPWSHPLSSRWEGMRDPARVIVEYAAAISGRISALASTHSSAPAVAAGVPWEFADGTVQAHPELVGGLMVTRYELGVPAGLRSKAAEITDSRDQRERALWAAVDADLRAGGQASSPRGRILAAMRADLQRIHDPRWLNSLDWDVLAEEREVLCGQERAARVDVRDAAVGAVDTGAAGRSILIQIYATEAALAVRHPVPERALHDAVYPWALVSEIPPPTQPSPIQPQGI